MNHLLLEQQTLLVACVCDVMIEVSHLLLKMGEGTVGRNETGPIESSIVGP